METPPFVHLHLHTDYSLLDGACEISELVDEAARRAMPAVAVTDHGNLFAAEHFYHEATTRGVKPIIGCEVYVARGSRHDRGADAPGRDAAAAADGAIRGTRPARHQSSGAAVRKRRGLPQPDQAGLRGFPRRLLLQAAHRLRPAGQAQPRVDRAFRLPEGRRCRTAAQQRYDDARTAAYRLQDIFGKGNFFLEVQDQGLDVDQPVNRELVRLSRESGIPLVATNDCHYLTRADARAQEVLMCIQTGKTMSDAHRMRFATDQFYFKTAEEMAQVFGELPEALDAHRGHRRALQCPYRAGAELVPGISRCPRATPSTAISSASSREGFAERVAAARSARQAGTPAAAAGRIRAAPVRTKSR